MLATEQQLYWYMCLVLKDRMEDINKNCIEKRSSSSVVFFKNIVKVFYIDETLSCSIFKKLSKIPF